MIEMREEHASHAGARRRGRSDDRRTTLHHIHPDFVQASVRCSTCGNMFTTRSNRPEIVVDVCSECHPAYTGVERAVRTDTRIERFERRRRAARTSVAA